MFSAIPKYPSHLANRAFTFFQCTLDGRITQLQALKGSRLTRLWLKKLERKKRALIRKKNETKLVEDWGVFERLLISESVEERHNRFVAREKVCSRKLNRASRQGGSNKDTVAALRTKLKKLKDRAGIFEDLAKSRGCDYKGERPKLQSTREKSRKRRRRKSIGHNRGLKSLLKVRQSWDKYLVGPGSGIAHQPRLD